MMNTIEYLMNEFKIDEQKAKEVAAKMKELAHAHHSHRQDENEGNEDPMAMIMEGEEEVKAFKAAASALHCNGCEKHCMIANAGCGRGRKVAQLLFK